MNRAIVGTPDLKSGHRDVPPPCQCLSTVANQVNQLQHHDRPPHKTLELAFLVIFYKSVSLQICSPLQEVWYSVKLHIPHD